MRVAEVMTEGVDPVDPSETVQAAATRMAEIDVGAVLVGTDEALEGVLTDRDIILRVVVEGRNPAEVTVRDVMSATLYSCSEDDSVEDVLAQMRERQIRRMPVLNAEGKPVGVVALSDLARAFSGPEQIQEALRDISEPHRKKTRDEPAEAEKATEESAEAKEAGEAGPETAAAEAR
jgi:CBS domain-containing protein